MGGCGGPQTIGKTLSTDFEIGPHPPPPIEIGIFMFQSQIEFYCELRFFIEI